MSLISLVYPTKHIMYQNLGEIGEIPCPTVLERLLKSRGLHFYKVYQKQNGIGFRFSRNRRFTTFALI